MTKGVNKWDFSRGFPGRSENTLDRQLAIDNAVSSLREGVPADDTAAALWRAAECVTLARVDDFLNSSNPDQSLAILCWAQRNIPFDCQEFGRMLSGLERSISRLFFVTDNGEVTHMACEELVAIGQSNLQAAMKLLRIAWDYEMKCRALVKFATGGTSDGQ